MGRIIKPQVYQILRDKLFYAVLALLTYAFGGEMIDFEYIRDGTAVGSDMLLFFLMMWASVTAFLLIYVQCRDRKDKTINCDILSGAGRKTVFFGRYAAAMIVGTAAAVIIGGIPIAAVTAANGWAGGETPEDLGLRVLAAVIIMFRLSAEVTLAAVLIKRMFPACAFCFAVGLVEVAKVEDYILPIPVQSIFSFYEYFLTMLVDSTEEFAADGSVVEVVDYAYSAAQFGWNVVYGLIVGIVCLTAAVKIFGRRDFE